MTTGAADSRYAQAFENKSSDEARKQLFGNKCSFFLRKSPFQAFGTPFARNVLRGV